MALILSEALNVQEDEGYMFLRTQHSLQSTLQRSERASNYFCKLGMTLGNFPPAVPFQKAEISLTPGMAQQP